MSKTKAELFASDRQYRNLRPDEVLDYTVEQAAILYILQERLLMTPQVYCAALDLARGTDSVKELKATLDAKTNRPSSLASLG